MFKEMRRKDRELSFEDAEKILQEAEYGVFCLNGEYPYGVPVSFAYRENKVYIHCAAEGHKLDLLAKDSRVSFTAVQNVRTRPGLFTADFESAMLFGKASHVEGAEKRDALLMIIEKYSAEHMEKALSFIGKCIEKTAVIKIEAEHITGKKSVHD
jgi:nitroimidazol reductase NimA-like FMN-containing flavoprotein (pyridoxamine 5'-phosphate oxidase superfamily)